MMKSTPMLSVSGSRNCRDKGHGGHHVGLWRARCVTMGMPIMARAMNTAVNAAGFPERQRQRDRQGMLPAQPILVIGKADGPAGFANQCADKTVVQIHAQRHVGWPPAHQNRSSISRAWPLVRSHILNSRSRAPRTARMESSFAGLSPLSITEIVAWRSPARSASCICVQFRFLRARWMRVPICLGVRARSFIASVYGAAHKLSIYFEAYKILKADSALHRLQRRQNYSF